MWKRVTVLGWTPREHALGAAAGLGAGLVFAIAANAQRAGGAAPGLAGVTTGGVGAIAQLMLGALAGAAYVALFRYQRGSAAAGITTGVLFGLLGWIAGPLTLGPLLEGGRPSWSLAEAGEAFPSLAGHLLFGGVLALLLQAGDALARRRWPEPVVEHAPRPAPRRLVVLGGGFGGVAAAQRLERHFERDPEVELTLVSQSNFLLFTPMLVEVASSGLEAQHISAPVRAALPRTRVHRAEVESIDTDARLVHIRATGDERQTLAYDQLVLALGSVPNFYGLPGLEEHSFTLKSLEDATRLRNHVISLLEHADRETDPEHRRRDLTFVVAGAGFAGTEMIAELFDLVIDVLRYYPGISPDEPRFLLVHSGDRILPELSPALGAYALAKLQARGIEFLLGRRVAGATATSVLLTDGGMIPTRTLVWTAGNQPNPALAALPCEHTRSGAVVADEMLRVKGLDTVWALGDCAQIPDVLNPGSFCPPTAQHALREGKTLGDNIAAALRGKPLKPFRFRTIGLLVALGRNTAAAELRGHQFSGLLAWMMWRSVYLSKLPGLEKKVRVALDWTLDLFFPRDIVLTSGREATSPGQRSEQEAVRRGA